MTALSNPHNSWYLMFAYSPRKAPKQGWSHSCFIPSRQKQTFISLIYKMKIKRKGRVPLLWEKKHTSPYDSPTPTKQCNQLWQPALVEVYTKKQDLRASCGNSSRYIRNLMRDPTSLNQSKSPNHWKVYTYNFSFPPKTLSKINECINLFY